MSSQRKSRREFLIESASGIGAAWIAANYAEIVAAQEFVEAAAHSDQHRGFAFFRPAEAAEIDAMAAQMIPTDATPGAREARVVAFIDRALVTFERDRQADYRQGLGDLAARTEELYPQARRFSSLASGQQIRVLTAIEETPFFELVRRHTITGFFSSPIHGGNYGKVGWELIGYDDSLDHEPPFGYYDSID
jgi:hypothetical protein